MNITKNQIEQYREDGYMILESVIPDAHLKLLRDLCQHFIDEMDVRMDREGTDVIGITHRGKRYFVSQCYQRKPELFEFLYSDYIADICRATLGKDTYLFNATLRDNIRLGRPDASQKEVEEVADFVF